MKAFTPEKTHNKTEKELLSRGGCGRGKGMLFY